MGNSRLLLLIMLLTVLTTGCASSPTDYVRRGDYQAQTGKYDKAERSYTNALYGSDVAYRKSAEFRAIIFEAFEKRAIAREKLGNVAGAKEDRDSILSIKKATERCEQRRSDLKAKLIQQGYTSGPITVTLDWIVGELLENMSITLKPVPGTLDWGFGAQTVHIDPNGNVTRR